LVKDIKAYKKVSTSERWSKNLMFYGEVGKILMSIGFYLFIYLFFVIGNVSLFAARNIW